MIRVWVYEDEGKKDFNYLRAEIEQLPDETEGYFLTDSELAARDAEIWEAARAQAYDYSKPVMGNLPYMLKQKYETFEDYQRSKQQEGEKI